MCLCGKGLMHAQVMVAQWNQDSVGSAPGAASVHRPALLPLLSYLYVSMKSSDGPLAHWEAVHGTAGFVQSNVDQCLTAAFLQNLNTLRAADYGGNVDFRIDRQAGEEQLPKFSLAGQGTLSLHNKIYSSAGVPLQVEQIIYKQACCAPPDMCLHWSSRSFFLTSELMLKADELPGCEQIDFLAQHSDIACLVACSQHPEQWSDLQYLCSPGEITYMMYSIMGRSLILIDTNLRKGSQVVVTKRTEGKAAGFA